MAKFYTTTNATLAEDVERRKYIVSFFSSAAPAAYAVAYGLIGKDGNKKLFRKMPVFENEKQFDRYIWKHKQTVMVVFNRHRENALAKSADC